MYEAHVRAADVPVAIQQLELGARVIAQILARNGPQSGLVVRRNGNNGLSVFINRAEAWDDTMNQPQIHYSHGEFFCFTAAGDSRIDPGVKWDARVRRWVVASGNAESVESALIGAALGSTQHE